MDLTTTSSTTHHVGALAVSAVAVGTMHFGTAVDAQTAMSCLDVAAEVGATFWDTANNYAFWSGVGDESETVIGDWFTSRGPSARDRITLASKVGARPRPGHSDLDHVQGLSARAVRDQVTGSLQRLRTDHLDLLYAHIDDPTVALAETLGVFGELVQEGLVREIGASNLTADRLKEALRTPSGHRYRALQQRFTYLPIRPGADTAPQVVLDLETERIASSAEITLVGYSPLLSGAYTRTDRPLHADYSTQDSRQRLDALRSVADEVGLDPGQVVLAWMNQRPTPVLPIVGVSRPEQVLSAWHAVTQVLPDHLIARLQAARA